MHLSNVPHYSGCLSHLGQLTTKRRKERRSVAVSTEPSVDGKGAGSPISPTLISSNCGYFCRSLAECWVNDGLCQASSWGSFFLRLIRSCLFYIKELYTTFPALYTLHSMTKAILLRDDVFCSSDWKKRAINNCWKLCIMAFSPIFFRVERIAVATKRPKPLRTATQWLRSCGLLLIWWNEKVFCVSSPLKCSFSPCCECIHRSVFGCSLTSTTSVFSHHKAISLISLHSPREYRKLCHEWNISTPLYYLWDLTQLCSELFSDFI